METHLCIFCGKKMSYSYRTDSYECDCQDYQIYQKLLDEINDVKKVLYEKEKALIELKKNSICYKRLLELKNKRCKLLSEFEIKKLGEMAELV